RLLHADFLFRDPAIGILTVERATRHRRVHTEHGIERRDRPVGAESQGGAGGEQRAERVGRPDPHGPDALLYPAAVVDGAAGLHRRGPVQVAEPGNGLGAKMSGVLDPEAAAATTAPPGAAVETRS